MQKFGFTMELFKVQTKKEFHSIKNSDNHIIDKIDKLDKLEKLRDVLRKKIK